MLFDSNLKAVLHVEDFFEYNKLEFSLWRGEECLESTDLTLDECKKLVKHLNDVIGDVEE